MTTPQGITRDDTEHGKVQFHKESATVYTDNCKSITPVFAAPVQAGAQERKPLAVLMITTAYEQGVGKGHQAHGRGAEIACPYTAGECSEAWELGYQEGKQQAAPKVPHKEQP